MDALPQVEEWTAELCRLLEEQVAAAREGDMARVERLGGSADAAVARIMQHYDDVPAAIGARSEHLKRLYEELSLMLRAEQADVRSELSQLRQVKRALGVYAGKTMQG